MGGSPADIKQPKPQVVNQRPQQEPLYLKDIVRPPRAPSEMPSRFLLSSPLLIPDSEGDIDTDEEGVILRRGHKKSVSFSSLEIREYEVVIGDHPCCTRGVPLSLGWEYCEGGSIPVDAYESERSPRRPRCDLRTTCEKRREILSETASQEDIRRAQRKLHRVRSCSAKLCERDNAKFFDSESVPSAPYS